MKETPRHPTTLRLTNATMLVSAWAAGACASMHSVLLSTQVSYTRDHNYVWDVSAALPFPGKLYICSFCFFSNFQPYWRNWRSVSLFALSISLPTWRSVWARAWPHCPPTSTWYFLSVSPMGCSFPLYARCLTLCCVNTTRALRSVSRHVNYQLFVVA